MVEELIAVCLGPEGISFGQYKGCEENPEGRIKTYKIWMRHPFTLIPKKHKVTLLDLNKHFDVPLMINGKWYKNTMVRVYLQDYKGNSLMGVFPKKIEFQLNQKDILITALKSQVGTVNKQLLDYKNENRLIKKVLAEADLWKEVQKRLHPQQETRKSSRFGSKED